MEREVTLRVEEEIYEQFMGSISLFRQVKVVSASAGSATGISTGSMTAKGPRGRGGRPKRTGRPVVKAFIYQGKEAGARLMMLCKGLMALGWIDRDTNIQTFIDLFSGGEVRQRIIWKGDVNTLAELFRRLVNERHIVALPEKHSLWVMVNGHFWSEERGAEYGIKRLRCTRCPVKNSEAIALMLNILDPKVSVNPSDSQRF